MIDTTYSDRREHLFARYRIAFDAHCFRTALARLRDIAHLDADYGISTYNQSLARLLETYPVHKK